MKPDSIVPSRRVFGARLLALPLVASVGPVRSADPPAKPLAQVSGAQHHRWPRSRATPVVELPRLEGGHWRAAEARGQVLVLNFWASWCEPCRAELPSLERLAETRRADRVQVLAVNYREHETTIRRFLERQPLALPVLRDVDGSAARAWQIRIFPTTVVIGRDGRAAFSVAGEVDWTGPVPTRWIASVL